LTERKEPLRTCIGCGEEKNKKELIRIVRTSEGEIFLDPAGKKNGRGAYVCRNPECIRKAFQTKGLDRSFKESVPAEVYGRLSEEMEKLGQG